LDFETETFILTTDFGGYRRGDDPTLRAKGGDCGGGSEALIAGPLPFDTTQITSATNRCHPQPGDICHPLAAASHPPAIAYRTAGDGAVFEKGDVTAPLTTGTDQCAQIIAFSSKDYGADAGLIAPTLRAMPHDGSHANAGGQIAVCVTGDIAHTLNTANNGKGCSEDGTGRGVPTIAVAYPINEVGAGWNSNGLGVGAPEDPAPTLQAGKVHGVGYGTAVRRLTPLECERLQGFPDGYTLIPLIKRKVRKGGVETVRGWHRIEADEVAYLMAHGASVEDVVRRENGAWYTCLAADGPRYKALGNSMAVPVMAWIFRRVQADAERIVDETFNDLL
jgi:hypothetical protein